MEIKIHTHFSFTSFSPKNDVLTVIVVENFAEGIYLCIDLKRKRNSLQILVAVHQLK